jgi:hypothetical protein
MFIIHPSPPATPFGALAAAAGDSAVTPGAPFPVVISTNRNVA